jgi:hypothetical protein
MVATLRPGAGLRDVMTESNFTSIGECLLTKSTGPFRNHNDTDPDYVTQQATAISLNEGAEGEIPTYAVVDMTKKKKRGAQNDIPIYAVVDKSKKKKKVSTKYYCMNISCSPAI